MTASGSEHAIEARGVGRRFRVGLQRRPTDALAGVDLTVPRGASITGLVGPNGSGKSTLLRILAGADRATAGTVRVLGGDPGEGAVRRRLAFLPDSDPFPPELRAPAALGIVARLRGIGGGRRAIAREVDALLERVGLAGARATPLGGYSRGMGRRFGLAQAFLGAPDLVLLDEPTAGLDAPGFPVLSDLLADARGRGAAVVLASHVATDLTDHCDQLALLTGGRLARAGTPDELLGDADRVEVVARAAGDRADDATVAAARDALESAGLRVERAGRARRSLAELYRAEQDR